MEKFSRARGLPGLFLIALAAIISACTQEPANPLRVGTNVWPGYEPLFLARDLGYFDDASVHLVEFSSATEVLRAFRNGTIDAACITLDEALLLAQDQQHPQIIVVTDISDGADTLLARPPITTLAELKGRRVAVENSALGAYMLTRALEHGGLQINDVDVIESRVDQHESAYLQGKVDAVVTFEPVRTRLLRAGAVDIFNSSQIPDEILDVIVVRRDDRRVHAQQVQRLLQGWYRALDYLAVHRLEAAARMAVREQITAEEFQLALSGMKLPSLEENRRLIASSPPGIVTSAQRLMTVMLDKKLLSHSIDMTSLVDSTPLRTLAASSSRQR